MIERLFILIGGLSSKVFAVAVTGTSGFLGVVIGEVMTSSYTLAGIAGAIATVFAGVVLVIPRVMEQKRKSRESAAKLQSDLLGKMTDLHKSEVDFYKGRVAALELIVTLHVTAKHDAVSEWGAALNAYNILATQLRARDIEPAVVLNPKTYKEILGESDDEIKKIAKTRVAEAPAFIPPFPIET